MVGSAILRRMQQREQRMSVVTRATELDLTTRDAEFLPPTRCVNLSGKRVFGIATFYGEMEFFHLFQSRKKRNIRVFAEVCGDVIAGRRLDFGRYLLTLNGKRRMPKFLRRYFG